MGCNSCLNFSNISRSFSFKCSGVSSLSTAPACPFPTVPKGLDGSVEYSCTTSTCGPCKWLSRPFICGRFGCQFRHLAFFIVRTLLAVVSSLTADMDCTVCPTNLLDCHGCLLTIDLVHRVVAVAVWRLLNCVTHLLTTRPAAFSMIVWYVSWYGT